MPTQTQARCKSLVRKQKELNVEKNLLLREILSDGTEDLIELHDCYRQTWVQLFWIQYLKMPIFFCLDMLEIWIQTIFEAQWSLRDPSVFQPFCCVSNVTHSGRANTAAAVIVHFQVSNTFFLNLIFWTWSSPRFQEISDFKLAIGQSHSDWQLLLGMLNWSHVTWLTQDYR